MVTQLPVPLPALALPPGPEALLDAAEDEPLPDEWTVTPLLSVVVVVVRPPSCVIVVLPVRVCPETTPPPAVTLLDTPPPLSVWDSIERVVVFP
jgi:hypothetical protein